MQTAGYLILLSAALHVVGVVLGSFAPSTWVLLLPAALYAVVYFGLARGWRWLAWLTFFMMLIGAAGALAEALTAVAVPAWVFWAIMATDLSAAVVLFGVLWRSPRPA
ncbi:MAG: hypothetical protein AAFQ36_02140 [Pseudomonadota bacterium]